MSSVKQEVAAILMDYTDKIPDDAYIGILNRLSSIPDHKDLKKASEIQIQLENTIENLRVEEERNNILLDEIEYFKQKVEDIRITANIDRDMKNILKEKCFHMSERISWLEKMCEDLDNKSNNYSRLVEENEYTHFGIDQDTKQIEECIESIKNLYYLENTEKDRVDNNRYDEDKEDLDIAENNICENSCDEDKEDSDIAENNICEEDENVYLDKIFNTLDRTNYGYYKYVSSEWWKESVHNKLVSYLLNNYITLYNWETPNYLDTYSEIYNLNMSDENNDNENNENESIYTNSNESNIRYYIGRNNVMMYRSGTHINYNNSVVFGNNLSTRVV